MLSMNWDTKCAEKMGSNGVHMWLRNYSVNISEKLMVVHFTMLGISAEIQPETH